MAWHFPQSLINSNSDFDFDIWHFQQLFTDIKKYEGGKRNILWHMRYALRVLMLTIGCYNEEGWKRENMGS